MQATTLQNDGPVTCCRIAAHDELGDAPMVACGIDRVVALFHGKQLKTKLAGATTPVSAIGMDKCARRVAAGTDGGSLRLWDVATGEAIQGFASNHRTTVTSVDYHPFADFIATASRDTHVRIWDLRRKSCLQVYRHKEGVAAPVEAVRIAPDGRTAASGCGDGNIRLYDLRGGKESQPLAHHTSAIHTIAFHPSRLMLAAADVSGVVSVWDLEQRKLVFSTDETNGAQHCGLIEGSLIVCSESLMKRFAVPNFEAAAPKPLRSGGAVGDVHTTATGRVYVAGINGASVNLTSVEARGAGGKGTAAGGGKRPGGASAEQPKRALPRELLAAVAASKDAAAGAKTAAPRTRSEPKVIRHDAGASPAGANASVPPEHLQPLSAVVPPVPQSQAVAAASERSFDTPQPKRPSPPQSSTKKKKEPTTSSPNAGNAGTSPSTLSPAAKAVDVHDLCRKGDTMRDLMERRATHTRMLRNHFTTRPDAAFGFAYQMLTADDGCTNDSGAIVGFMDSISSNARAADRITLETLTPALKLADQILQRHSQARYVGSAVELSRVLWKRHRMAVNETRRAARVAVGVDLSLEARLEKANAAAKLYAAIKTHCGRFVTHDNEAGAAARKFLEEFDD